MVGVGSGAAVLLVGLEDPFRGPFSIQLEAMQLTAFEKLLDEDIETAESESKVVGHSALITLDRKNKRPNYNTSNTIMFHLLTGPWATPVRYLGDLVAWTYTRIARTVIVAKAAIQSLKSRMKQQEQNQWAYRRATTSSS
jgi:hypothetical protein